MSTPLSLPGRFTALDGWRGICALLVAVYHFHTVSHVEGLGLVRHAYLFVDFFFVLSGFVISAAYAGRLETARDAAVMIARRLARLWPLHAVMLVAFVALELSSPIAAILTGVPRSAAQLFDPASPNQLAALPSNLFLVHALGLHDRLTWNYPSWSISAEIWVYVLFAIAMVTLRRARVPVVAGAAVVAAFVLMALSDRRIAVDYDLGVLRCIYGFAVGYLVHRLMTDHDLRPALGTWGEIATASLLVAFVVVAGGTRAEFAAPLVFALAVSVFAMESGAVSQVLKSRPLARLGLYSYSIYLVHALVITLAHRVCSVAQSLTGLPMITEIEVAGAAAKVLSFGSLWMMDAIVVVYAGLVVGMAALTWRFIEMPAQQRLNSALERWLQRLDQSAKGRPVTSSAAG